jgi:hypothetical protein
MGSPLIQRGIESDRWVCAQLLTIQNICAIYSLVDAARNITKRFGNDEFHPLSYHNVIVVL